MLGCQGIRSSRVLAIAILLISRVSANLNIKSGEQGSHTIVQRLLAHMQLEHATMPSRAFLNLDSSIILANGESYSWLAERQHGYRAQAHFPVTCSGGLHLWVCVRL